jgi:hypothetical protein
MVRANIPIEFWQELKNKNLIEVDFVSWLQQSITT